MIHHDVFLDTLHLLNIRPEKPIFAQLQEIYGKHEVVCADGVTRSYNEVRKILMNSLELANSLFDIHMVYNVITTPKVHDIAFCWGTSYLYCISVC
jgi:hypothetical protein